MTRPPTFRPYGIVATSLLALAVIAFTAPARAAGPPRIPEPVGTEAMLSAQKQAALRIAHASIWEGASEQRRELREQANARRHARTAHRATAPGQHARRVPLEAGATPSPPGPGFTSANRALALPANVRCNDPSHDGFGATQSECHAAGIGNQVVVDWNNGQGFWNGTDLQGVGWSNDGGVTFTDAGPLAHVPGHPTFRWIGDPIVTANEKTGDYYLCGLARPDGTHNGIAVARGRFTGGAFAMDSAWMVRTAANNTHFLDKEWMACDSSTGNLYVTNTTFGAVADTIDLYRSTDGGRSWSSPITLSSNADAGWVQGSRVVVAANGDVVVAWYATDQVTVENDLRFRRSTDHGLSFGPEVTPVKFNEQFGTGAPGFNRDWGPNFPSLAVDRTSGPHAGRTYLAWAESWRFLATPVPVGLARFDAEPNGNAPLATPFSVGQTLRGTLNTSFYGVLDQDWYACTLAAGQNLVVFADSVSAPSGWILRLVAPDGTQRLCRGGVSDSTQNPDPNTAAQAYYAFTAPASGTYYLDMYAQSYAPITYAIRTAFGTRGSERGRDQRDGFVSWSDDGVTWSAPVRIDDDAIGYDLVYPELAVGSDGAVYATWFDHRDDPYGSRANVYATRSTDGGQTWAGNQLVSSAQGNFTTAASNIAPNMGDYNALDCAGTTLIAAWGDGRDPGNAGVDAWAAPLDLTSDLAGCPNDTTLAANSTGTFAWTIANHDPVFAGDYTLAFASSRHWPLPAPLVVPVGAAGSARATASFAVPDTAADGADTLCATLRTPAGVVVRQCCFRLGVSGSLLAVGPGNYGMALAPCRPNPTTGDARLDFVLAREGHVRLVIYDLTGARVRTLVDDTRPSGPGSARWDGRTDRGSAARPGAYFYRLSFGGHDLTRSLVLTR